MLHASWRYLLQWAVVICYILGSTNISDSPIDHINTITDRDHRYACMKSTEKGSMSLITAENQIQYVHIFRMTYLRVHSSPPSAAYMRQWIGWALVQKTTCRLFGAKPLSETMLFYCQLLGYCLRNKVQRNFNQKSKFSIKTHLEMSSTKMMAIYFDLCYIDPWPLTLTCCMYITSVSGNYFWKFHDDTIIGTCEKVVTNWRTDIQTDRQDRS